MTKLSDIGNTCLTGGLVMMSVLANAEDMGEFPLSLLRLTKPSVALLGRSSELMGITPVLLPCGDNLLGKNDHFGWPVATLTGRSLVVVFHRKPAHFGGHDKPDEHSSTAVVVRSDDGGKTWSAPYDLRGSVRTETQACRLGFGNSIGLDAQGRVVVVTSFGVFRSSDEGRTWQHLPGAYGGDQLAGPRCNNGPRLILHPDHGLVAAGHSTQSDDKNDDGTPYVPPTLWFRASTDGGEHWREQSVDLPDFATAIEPTLLLHDGRLMVVARCHGRSSYEPQRGTWRYVQLWSARDWLPLQAKLTNIRTTGKATGWHGPWSQDTVDLAFNPVSRRIEVVATNRDGGGPDNEAAAVQTLNLWSIAPEEFPSGDWRFEATLLTREAPMTANCDGMHPGAAVIDEERGVQHIFIYAGRGEGPSGIFRIARTLDTGKLTCALGRKVDSE